MTITLQNDTKFTEIGQPQENLLTLRFPLLWYSGNEFTAGKIVFWAPWEIVLQENTKKF